MSTLTWQSPQFDPLATPWPKRLRERPARKLDRKRVAAIALVVAAHLLIAGTLLLPQKPMPLRSQPSAPVTLSYESAPRIRPPDPPPVKIETERTTRIVTARNSTPAPAPAAPTQPAISATSAASAEEFALPVSNPAPLIAPAPQETDSSEALLVLKNPAPRYPPRAVARGMQGKVQFRVTVDIKGRVQDIALVATSGHRELDRAALSHIKRHWLFQPRTRNGEAIVSSGIGSVQFSLSELR
jgi:periplasmic protein TonB